MKIDKTISIPLYEQVKNSLKEKVLTGEWGEGDRLPTEKELTKSFSVSSITVKRAVHDLVNDGLLYRQSGRGTFVKRREEKNISKLVTLKNEEWKDAHHPHRTLSFKKTTADSAVCKCLGIELKDEVYKIKRIKMENDTPIAIEYSFLPAKLVPDLPSQSIENDLLYNVLEKRYKIKLGKARVYFSIFAADEHESNLLEVPIGQQLNIIERYTYTSQEEIIEYSKVILKNNGARYYLEIDI